ncbi:MAG TPA: glycosyltransferase family 39 protein [Anaerolineales bacterium]|nr:glycosyltransferase family 39 protein [Anaerolineales bacterium]
MKQGQKQREKTSPHLRALLWFWLVGVLQGLLAIGLILAGRTATESGISLSLSASRLLVAGLVLLPTILFLSLAYLHRSNHPKYQRWAANLRERLDDQRFWLLGFLLSGIVFFAGGYLITATPEIEEPFTRSLLENILPLVIYLSGLATQSLLLLLSLRLNQLREIPKPKIFLFSAFLLGLTFLTWAWIAQVALPQESQVRGWNSLGVPIMETQLFLAWAISLVFLVILTVMERGKQTKEILLRLKPTFLDLLICILIWTAALLTWQSIPTPTSWFITEDRPPNFEPYPNSDAYHYDISAQTALVGEGFVFFDTPFIRRPLHAAYLTLLHTLAGQDFSQVITLQLLVLAFLPVLVYLVGCALHSRLTGLLAALLILMREASSIAISGNITASHVKLLMVDVPVALMVTLFVLAVLHWLQNLKQNKLNALIAGSVLGAGILIRAETAIFIIPLGFVLWLVMEKDRRARFWTQQMLLFAWGVILVLSPWVWRNYSLTGAVFLDTPIMRFDLIAQRYQDINATPPIPPEPAPAPTAISEPVGEPAPQAPIDQPTPAAVTQPTQESAAEQYVKSVAQQTMEFIARNPGAVAKFIISHYTNSQLQTLLIFPTSLRPLDSLVGLIGHRSLETFWVECCSMQNYTRRLPFWRKWDGAIPSQSTLPIILNIILVSWGFQVAWRKKGIISLSPIAFTITYLLLNAFFRNSGGRYILPVDWIPIVYLSIGLTDLSTRLLQKIRGVDMPAILAETTSENQAPKHKSAVLRTPPFYGLSVLILLFASLIPFTEKAFAQRYTPDMQNKLTASLLQSDMLKPDQRSALEDFLTNGGAIVSGRALYPRFFREFLGEPGSNNPFGPRPYPRIGFYLAGPQHSALLLPATSKPAYFPHASDVLVYQCSADEVFAVAVFDESSEVHAFYMRSPLPLNLGCPFLPQDISIQVK